MKKEKIDDFTPQDMKGKRLKMSISIADYSKMNNAKGSKKRGFEWVEITELNTNIKYLARRIPCGLDCYCDAQVMKIGGDKK